jgi:hypothetical protein
MACSNKEREGKGEGKSVKLMGESYHSAISFRVVAKFISFSRECIAARRKGWNKERKGL